MRDPTVNFPLPRIAELALRYKIDQATLEAIIADASCRYRAVQWSTKQGYGGSDTLDETEKLACDLLRSLTNKVNHHRLAVAFFERGGESALSEFCELLPSLLENVRLAAAETHQPRKRGRPKARDDLEDAYKFLVEWYRRLFGDEAFTNKWNRDDAKELVPTSHAAYFLYDMMKMIDSERQRLAEELRDLMADTIKRRNG
jgi:hypothetical protein